MPNESGPNVKGGEEEGEFEKVLFEGVVVFPEFLLVGEGGVGLGPFQFYICILNSFNAILLYQCWFFHLGGVGGLLLSCSSSSIQVFVLLLDG